MWKGKFSQLIVLAVMLTVLGCATGQKAMIGAEMNGKDITVQLNSMLREAKSGREISIPGGSYLFSSNIVVPSDITLRGVAGTGTELRSQNGAVILVQNVSNVSIKDLKLIGISGHTGIEVRSSNGRKEKIATTEMSNIEINQVVLDNVSFPAVTKPRHGISVKTHGDSDITNVRITNCRVTGAYGTSSFSGFDNCYIASYDAPGSGQVRNVLVENCNFSRAGRQNLSIAGKGQSKPRDVIIKNCTFSESALAGVDLEEASAVTIDNCTFRGNGKNQEYFIHNKPSSSMRSGLVVHNSDVIVSGSTFENCYYGYSSVNTQGEGVSFKNCTFSNAPVSNGSFAGMAFTDYENCTFSGRNVLADMYNASFVFRECVFRGGEESQLIIGGGGLKKRTDGQGKFEHCRFEGQVETAVVANYESLEFMKCRFQGQSNIIGSSGNNRQNTLLFNDCSFANNKQLGNFGYQTINSLRMSNSTGVFSRSLLVSNFKNGDFSFEGNDLRFPAGTSTIDKFTRFAFKNNTLHPAAAPAKSLGPQATMLVVGRKPGKTEIENNQLSGVKSIKVTNE